MSWFNKRTRLWIKFANKYIKPLKRFLGLMPPKYQQGRTRAKENLVVFYSCPSNIVKEKAKEWFGNENVVKIDNVQDLLT